MIVAFGGILFFIMLFAFISLVPIALMSIVIINQYERAVVFRLGKYNRILEPGLNFRIPLLESIMTIDIRVSTEDVPDQDCITKDNVSVRVNAVLYYKVVQAKDAVIEVYNYHYATSQLAQTTMRDVIGEVSLDQLLANRDQISAKIRHTIDEATDPWGIKVSNVELKHIELPKDMVRTMAKAAEADRERQAVIIKAEGELVAAKNMASAAKTLASSPGALHLRTLQTLNDLSSDQSNTIVMGIPLEILRGFTGKGR